jgi:hypothetical protein
MARETPVSAKQRGAQLDQIQRSRPGRVRIRIPVLCIHVAMAIVLATRYAEAQRGLQVAVVPQIVARSGDTVSLAYVVHVLAASRDSLVGFFGRRPRTSSGD